jgi:hypothetical protein
MAIVIPPRELREPFAIEPTPVDKLGAGRRKRVQAIFGRAASMRSRFDSKMRGNFRV